MRQSQLFTKTTKDVPADEISRNAELLIRGGFIHKQLAGVYAFLPLGLRVTQNIAAIVREEMNAIGGQEIKMTVLQDKVAWEKSGRWDDDVVDIWFKSKLHAGGEVGAANTHEEPLTDLLKHHVHSYRDLPLYPYQIQVKLRNELRAKSGLLRGREFLMKDLYSFSKDQAEHDSFYEAIAGVYKKIFDRVGIGHLTYKTFASGGSFAKYSHEFQTILPAGEDTIYLDEERGIAINKEVYTDEVISELGLEKEKLIEHRASEVGNIFTLGTRFSEPLDFTFEDQDGTRKPVFMGSYGIGITRLMGVIVEALADDHGIIWPESIAPAAVHLLALGDGAVATAATTTYETLMRAGIDVLFDDRTGVSAGEKFADSDLLGIPYRVVVSTRSMEENGVEVKKRTEEKGSIVTNEELLAMLQ